MLISSIKGITVMSQTTMPATTPAPQTQLRAPPAPIRPLDADTWDAAAADIEAITELKREKDAVILAHNYMTGDIFHGVADITGDSLALAREAATSPSRRSCWPESTSWPRPRSSSTRVSASCCRICRPGAPWPHRLPPRTSAPFVPPTHGVPVVTYVNTSVAVKAASDICCTSGNALRVVESLGVDRVIMIPDQYLARNIAAQTGVDMIIWPGACEVHEQFTAAEVRALRDEYGVTVLAHPECPPGSRRGSRCRAPPPKCRTSWPAVAPPCRAGHRMLDERQPRRRPPGGVHRHVPAVPAHAAHYLERHPNRARDRPTRDQRRPGNRRPRPPRRRAHARRLTHEPRTPR